MKQNLFRFILTIGLFVATWTPAAACSPAPWQLEVTCPDGTTVRALNDEEIVPKLPVTWVAALDPAVIQLIQARQNRQKEFFSETRFGITPWNAAQAATLSEQEQHLFTCQYQTWQQVGEWLVYEDAVRTYCGSGLQIGGSCVGVRFSPIGFAGYVLFHPQSNTLPYFAIIGGSLLIGGWFFVRRTKRGQLLTFLRPHRVLVIMTTIMGVGVGCFFATSVLDLMAWIVGLYLVACILSWRFSAKQRLA